MSIHNHPVVSLVNNELRTLSTDVAAYFGKRHDHVLRDIRQTMANCPESFNAPNLGEVEKRDAKGEIRPCYSLTKDAFMLVVMGFTGHEAMQCKLAYIEAFNQMEAELSGRLAESSRSEGAEPPFLNGEPRPGRVSAVAPFASEAGAEMSRPDHGLNDVVHMGGAIDYSRTLRQMARLKNYSPSQRLGFLAEAASVLSGRPVERFLGSSG